MQGITGDCADYLNTFYKQFLFNLPICRIKEKIIYFHIWQSGDLISEPDCYSSNSSHSSDKDRRQADALRSLTHPARVSSKSVPNPYLICRPYQA